MSVTFYNDASFPILVIFFLTFQELNSEMKVMRGKTANLTNDRIEVILDGLDDKVDLCNDLF